MKSSVLERPRPIGQGAFLLPTVHADIPQMLNTNASRHQTLARFALAADRCGVPLPGSDFVSIDSVVTRQWTEYLDSHLDEQTKKYLKCSPYVTVSDQVLSVDIMATNSITTVLLKPVIERLEAFHPGLGWYVTKVISESSRHGIKLYEPDLVIYLTGGFWDVYETDQEYAKNLLDQQGQETSDEVTDEQMDALREDYCWWPSDLLNDVGGHQNMLGWQWTKECHHKEPHVLTQLKVKALSKSSKLPSDLKKVVGDALALESLFKEDAKCPFNWHPSHDSADQDEYADAELIGAACAIAWKCPDLLFEAIEHVETRAMECGESVEIFGRSAVKCSATDEELEQLARDTRAYFEQWNLLGKLLSNFPAQ